jgi:spore maturation protein CgeB
VHRRTDTRNGGARVRIVIFCHSLVSDWNHGNAHFLRGICSELVSRGHALDVYEPAESWSATNLIAEHGALPLARFARAYPGLGSHRYAPATIDLARVLEPAELVIVHEWNDHDLVARIGNHRRSHAHYRLLFHDTHHRSATDPASMARYALEHYDGVLAYGSVIRDLYRSQGWVARAWTWHEGADVRVFRPLNSETKTGDLVWIGNWGDDERTAELDEFLLEPVRALRLRAHVYGVRYPEDAKRRLISAGIDYRGWLANYEAPGVYARHRATVHVPRRPYASALPGIPTIRVFEALACGIPLVSAPWDDCGHLFTPGADFLIARNGSEMKEQLGSLLTDSTFATRLAAQGLRTILARHTCAHRVDELLAIYRSLVAADQELEVQA